MSESPNASKMKRVQQLTLDKCSGILTDEGVSELSDALATSEEARTVYWEMIAVHSQLEWELGSSVSPVVPTTGKVDAPKNVSDRSSTLRIAAWTLAASACVAIAFLSTRWERGPKDQTQTEVTQPTDTSPTLAPILGTLTSLVPQCRWTFGQLGDQNSNSFRQGDTLWLEEGALELRLTSGAVALLESPLVMQASALDRVRLIRGAVKVGTGNQTSGLSVETSMAEVTDLGTTYSVSVEDGNTDVVVFDGEVDLKLATQAKAQSRASPTAGKRIQTGQAVHVSVDGTLSRIISVQQSSLATKSSHPKRSPRSLISSVRDNNARDDFFSFYEIIPGGMQEDAPAFVDRPHQWNGISREGMPSYLLGGDYVKTFNDDKISNDLQIEIAVNQPVTIYVLLDDRVLVPDWISGSFEDTGDNIGVDEVDVRAGKTWQITTDNLPFGAGLSINRKHSIWKRVIRQPGSIELGCNGWLPDDKTRRRSAANMYGIVAVPLAPEI